MVGLEKHFHPKYVLRTRVLHKKNMSMIIPRGKANKFCHNLNKRERREGDPTTSTTGVPSPRPAAPAAAREEGEPRDLFPHPSNTLCFFN